MERHDPTFDQIIRESLGFDVDAEVDFCVRLTREGGAGTVSRQIRPERAVRLFQALLNTGRINEMGDEWKHGVDASVSRGVIARPEWN